MQPYTIAESERECHLNEIKHSFLWWNWITYGPHAWVFLSAEASIMRGWYNVEWVCARCGKRATDYSTRKEVFEKMGIHIKD